MSVGGPSVNFLSEANVIGKEKESDWVGCRLTELKIQWDVAEVEDEEDRRKDAALWESTVER